MNERRQRIEALFDAAIQLDTSEQREAYLNKLCSDDTDLQAEVADLIRIYEKAGKYLTAGYEEQKDREQTIFAGSPMQVDMPITSKVTSISSVALILVLGVLTSFTLFIRPELLFFTGRGSVAVSDLADFDSFSEADIAREIREAKCTKFLLHFYDDYGQFFDREMRYFGQYQRWLQKHAQDDSVENFRMYQMQSGKPPVFDSGKWIPLIEAKLQEFEGTAEATRLKGVLLMALQKGQNP